MFRSIWKGIIGATLFAGVAMADTVSNVTVSGDEGLSLRIEGYINLDPRSGNTQFFENLLALAATGGPKTKVVVQSEAWFGPEFFGPRQAARADQLKALYEGFPLTEVLVLGDLDLVTTSALAGADLYVGFTPTDIYLAPERAAFRSFQARGGDFLFTGSATGPFGLPIALSNGAVTNVVQSDLGTTLSFGDEIDIRTDLVTPPDLSVPSINPTAQLMKNVTDFALSTDEIIEVTGTSATTFLAQKPNSNFPFFGAQVPFLATEATPAPLGNPRAPKSAILLSSQQTQIELRRFLAINQDVIELGLEFAFLEGLGALDILLGDELVGVFESDRRGGFFERLDVSRYLGLDDLPLTLRFTAPGAAALQVQNIIAPGIEGGGFANGLEGWELVDGPGGLVRLSSANIAPVPVPPTVAMALTGVGLLGALSALGARRSRRDNARGRAARGHGD